MRRKQGCRNGRCLRTGARYISRGYYSQFTESNCSGSRNRYRSSGGRGKARRCRSGMCKIEKNGQTTDVSRRYQKKTGCCKGRQQRYRNRRRNQHHRRRYRERGNGRCYGGGDRRDGLRCCRPGETYLEMMCQHYNPRYRFCPSYYYPQQRCRYGRVCAALVKDRNTRSERIVNYSAMI